MNILITGATSFIGINLIQRLTSDNHNVLAVVRKNSKKKELLPQSDLVDILELNMCDYKEISNVLPYDIDCAFHLSWNGTRGSDRDDEVMQNENLEYSYDLIKELCEHGTKKIFLAGSQAQYGINDRVIDESAQCQPKTQYGKKKLELFEKSMHLCKQHGTVLIEPRFFSLYGEGDFSGTMVISILKKMLNDEPCELTRCVQNWNFLHIEDAVYALVSLMTNDVLDGAYNFGSDDTRQLKSFIQQMQDITNTKSKLIFGAVEYPKTGIVSIMPDITKLKAQAKWQPNISFEAGIQRIIDWLKVKV